MKVKFLYPYNYEHLHVLEGAELELLHLEDDWAIFMNSQGEHHRMPIDLFFKITERVDEVKEKPKRSAAFKPPTVEEVAAYCNERCNNVNAQEFVDHYSANNWFRGKAKIKDWKACVRTWEKNTKAINQKIAGKTSGNLSACEDFINER
jgi:hypothetical protein